VKGPVEIVPGVYGLGSEIINWYVVESEGKLTAVDAGLPGFGDSLEADLKTIAHRPSDIEALVLTHSDSDHTGIASALRAAGSRILIHSDDEGTLAKPRPKGGDASPIHLLSLAWRPGFWRLIRHFAKFGGLKQRGVGGADTFADGDVLDVPGGPRVIHTPGHTPGHCALLFEGAGALFVGDALCTLHVINGQRGPQLMPSALNTSNRECLESLDLLAGVEAQVLLPGHGEAWRGAPAEAAERARAVGRT
jgi:glyoxylase-like metal-dependent hydrolase (beta-lactamase superfamily II)